MTNLLPAATMMGAVTLRVANLDYMIAYYRDGVGLDVLLQGKDSAILGRVGQPALIIEHSPELKHASQSAAGLFHSAFLFDTQADLAAAVMSVATKYPGSFTGSADHLVSEAFYFDDPEGNGVEPTRLVAEILDGSKTELARVAAVDDLVVSDNLAALLIAQVSENPALAAVFDDLFDAEGAALNVKPVDHYVTLGKEVEYAELVAIGRSHGESVIGYRVAADAKTDAATGVKLNPVKTTKFKPADGDALVVISDL